MLENYLKFLISVSKTFEKKQGIIDIIVYGSSVKGKIEPRDIDVVILFDNVSIDRRLIIIREFKEKTKDKITLSTIHSAKGLEWAYVFLMSCNERTLPFYTRSLENTHLHLQHMEPHRCIHLLQQ